MKYTLLNIQGFYKNSCLGIAANQIGINQRIIMISKYPTINSMKQKFIEIMINPEIIDISKDKSILWEGCISDDE
jgi:peptide deformylase